MKAKVKTALYAAKLRKAIAEEKRLRVTALRQHALDVESYKRALGAFFRTTVMTRVDGIRAKAKQDRYGRRNIPDLDMLISGAPDYPEYPTDDRIRKLTKRLNFVAISAPTSITIDEDDDLIPPGGDQ